MDSRLLTIRDVAEYLAVSEASVRRMAGRGDIPSPLRIGGAVRWDRSALDRWLDGREKGGEGYADPDKALAE